MRISTTARHFELAPDDRSFAHERVEKFTRFASDILEVHMVVTAESYRFVAEVTVRLKHRELACRGEDTDARRAIDRMSDRVERQLRRLHARRVDRRRSGPSNGLPESPLSKVDEEFEEAGED